MALLAAWGYWRWRETRSPWLARMAVPFATACIAMTLWYIARYWLAIRPSAIPVLAGVASLSLLTFVLMLFWPRRSSSRPPETGSPPPIP
jgi:membrane protein YqaA with SNARE-associated domain